MLTIANDVDPFMFPLRTCIFPSPIQLEDEVLILAAQVMLYVYKQQRSLAKTFYNLTPQAASLGPDKGVIGEGLVTHYEGALPSRTWGLE